MQGKSLRILWTLPYLPWPTTSGGKLRQYHLLRTLSERGHRITLLVQSKQAADDAVRAKLHPMLEQLIVLPRRSLKHPWTLVTAALASYPMLVSVNGFAHRLERVFSDLLKQQWDIVQIEHSYGLQPFLKYLEKNGQAFILTEHNVESTLGAATYQHLPPWLHLYVLYDQWRYRRWEKKALTVPTRLAAVTTEDAAKLAERRGREVDVVINGVDARSFANVQPDGNSRRILFVGNLEYPPNLDAVEWTVTQIMPHVWKQLPDARFAICGYAMPQAWHLRWTDPRLEWVGFVPDLKVAQQRAAVFIAPLREGGGSKLKVLEAMAAGLPLVSTVEGVSGLNVNDGVHYRQGNTPQAMAQALVDMMRHSNQARLIGETGRRYVTENHDWEIAATQLESIYEGLLNAHRH